ncbi:MAG: TonB-dependent receptor, partial [Flavobacteriaceae bacterium]|nr:TonB-dependent receptor [Flavobacteriaceae bacterium]
MIQKRLLFVFILLSLFCLTTLNAQTKKGKQPLTEILEKLHSRFECNFSYIDHDIADIYIEPPPEESDLQAAITYLQSNTPLSFTFIGKNFITISKNQTNGFTICGYLIDINTNDVIQGVVVQTKNESTISDEKGYFKLDRVNKDDIISIRHIGYKIVTEYAEKLNTKQCETFFLEPKVEDLNEIILTNYLTNGINKVIDGSISINYKNFGTVPGLIETDVLQTLQAIPGFQSVSETVSHLNIRGGTHDQNLILWDGIKIYQSGHFFGLISTMNPRMTRRVSLYKNGTPANYTDGVSGTVDMKTDYEVNRQLKAELGMNFINMDAFVDVPIRKNSSLQLASRTSISDYFNTPTYLEYFDRVFQNTDVLASSNNSNTTNQKFDFHDFSLRWIYDFTEKDKLRVNFLHLSNAIVISENAFGGSLYSTRESSLKQRNWSGGLNYSRIWNSKLKTDAQFYANKYQLEAKNFDILNEQILIQGNEILETGFYVNSKYTLNDQLSFEGGYQLTESGISNSNKLNAPPVDEYEKDVIDEHGLFVS